MFAIYANMEQTKNGYSLNMNILELCSMTNAIISDTTGKTISKDMSYVVKVKNQSTGMWIEFDTEFNDQLKNMIALAREHGCQWFKWHKIENSDRLEKIYDEGAKE